MSRRKERIRKGLEIDYDLLDSDMLRWYIQTGLHWTDGPQPRLLWVEMADRDGWTEGKDPEARVMTRSLDDETERAEGRRFLRLTHYKSYACLADLAARRKEPGEFVIRRPPVLGNPRYVCAIDESVMTVGLADTDDPGYYDVPSGFHVTGDLSEALRFPHAEALRLTARVMRTLGHDVPGDHGDYYEPLRADVAAELHARAQRRPRRGDALYAMIRNLSREP